MFFLTLLLLVNGVLSFYPFNNEKILENVVMHKLPIGPPTDYVLVPKDIKHQPIMRNAVSRFSNDSTIHIPLNPGIQVIKSVPDNSAFFIDVKIGNQTYSLILDTGSAYSWVYGADCDSVACVDQKLYPTTTVDSSDDLSTKTFALAYGTQTVSGNLTTDSFEINELNLKDFRFGIADDVPSLFDNYNTSGILGLPSNDTIASIGLTSLLQDLADEGQITDKFFSISLNSDIQSAGVLVIGEQLDYLYQDELFYTEVISNSNSYWMFEITSVYLDDNYQIKFNDSITVDNQSSNYSRRAILDSGTTAILLPSDDALLLHSFFQNSITDGTNYAIYCNSTIDVNLEIGGNNFTVSPQDYLGVAYSESSSYYGYCVSNFQGTNILKENAWILGTVFLKEYYALFDLEDQQIGIARQNKNIVFVEANSTALPNGTASPISTTPSPSSSNSSSSGSTSSGSLSKTFSSWTLICSISFLLMIV